MTLATLCKLVESPILQSIRTLKRVLTPFGLRISVFSSTVPSCVSIYRRISRAPTRIHRILKVYETESYDYPTQIQESLTQLSSTIGQGFTKFAAENLKGTSLPIPTSPTAPAPTQHKTLPHAIGRAASSAAESLSQTNNAGEDKLCKALTLYSTAWDKVRACNCWNSGQC